MANTVVNRQVNVYINSGEAAKAYDVLIKREKLLNAELAKTTDPKRIKQLTAELDKLKDPIDRATKKMKGEMAPSIRDLELATRKFLNEFKKTGDPETLRKFQQFQAELNKAKLQLNDLGEANKGLSGMGIFKSAFWANLAAGGITAATSALSGFFSSSIEEALQADLATKKLKSTLDNLGQSDSFDRITDKADQMAEKFAYLDNDDIVGVFNKLIDYGKLTEQQMNDLLPVIIDFAAKSNISIDESASVIIKAMEGNGKALKEFGINIKDAGTESERLQVIMTTLKEKVDGAAAAFQDSAAGGIATAKQEFANLKEELGNNLIPVLSSLLGWFNKVVIGLKYIGQSIKESISNAFDDIKGFASDGFDGLEKSQAERAKKFREKIEQGSAKDLADRLTSEAIQAQLDFIYKSKAVKASLLSRGGIDQKTYDREIARIESQSRIYSNALDMRLKFEESQNQILGTGSDTKNDDKVNEALKKAIEERKRLVEELNKIKFDQSLYDLPALDKEMKLVDKKYSEFRERAKGDKELLLRIEDLYLTEKLQLIDTYTDREINAWQKANEKIMTAQDKQFAQNLKRLSDRAKEVLNGKNDGSVKAQTALTLQNQADDEAAAKARRDKRNQEILEYISYAETINSILTQIGQDKTDQENAELERDRRLNDKKIKSLDSRLKKGVISQQQYDREVQKIEKEQEKRERAAALNQFRRKQQAAIFSAVINNAQGVTKTIAENGFPKAIPFLIAQGILFLSQIATISKQKPPEFAQGGLLGGRSHSAGGNPVLDGSGRKIAEVEAGEGIVNKRTMADRSRYSLSGTPSQIISRLNGMYGSSWEGGATLIPGWRSYSPQRMNYSAMKRTYADGGVMASNSGDQGSDSAIFENFTALLTDMRSTQAYLASVLENGIVADVSLTRFEDQQKRLTTIRRDATLQG